ncbi:unnamed protein product [Sphagnum jensenii]
MNKENTVLLASSYGKRQEEAEPQDKKVLLDKGQITGKTCRIEEPGSPIGTRTAKAKAPGAHLEIGELVELNHELSDENEYLESKLAEAEDYIRKLEGQQSLVIKEVEHLRLNPARVEYEKDPVFFHLNVEIERLKN